jgi:hypothetical protein
MKVDSTCPSELNFFFMIMMRKIGFNLFLAALSLAALPVRGTAYNFHYPPGETTLLNTDLNNAKRWLLNGTAIASGTLKATAPWGSASYPLPPARRVNLAQGKIVLYWSGFFPMNARTEPDKYYLGLQYADNAPVCYDSQSRTIVGYPPCRGDSVSLVDENAELKVEIRPQDRTNLANTYHRLYIDPDFDPVSNYSPASTRLEVPPYLETVLTEFRLEISQIGQTARANLSFWDGRSWQLMKPKPGYSLPLSIASSDWIDGERQVENPIVFEAINILFRQGNSTRRSEITAVALTQIRSQARNFQVSSVQVDEPSPKIYSFLGLCLSLLVTRYRRVHPSFVALTLNPSPRTGEGL